MTLKRRKTVPNSSLEVWSKWVFFQPKFSEDYIVALWLHQYFRWVTNPCLTYLGRAYPQCGKCYLSQAKSYEASARHLLVTVFQKSGSCYKHVSKSWKNPDGYTILHYIRITFRKKIMDGNFPSVLTFAYPVLNIIRLSPLPYGIVSAHKRVICVTNKI